ncbi:MULTISPECIES: TetR/AcrR family transcriptional regulator [unclassified Streptomyces]|uniref:TetR/AcrR family transcriptional regulator n=1 Tax=unclassified Streptomyces TaxID=2593676 RepID=UPI003D8C74D2
MPSSPEEAPGREVFPGNDGRVARDDAEILRRGLITFSELGYQATSVRELAKRLEVSHNFINDRYGSKENFWRAVIDFAVEDLWGDLFTTFEQTDDAEVLRIVITRFLTLATSHPHLARIVADESVHDSGRLDYLAGYSRKFWTKVMPVIQRLMNSGRMPQVPPQVVFAAIHGAALALTHQPLYNRLGQPVSETAQDINRMAETLAVLVIEGLLPSSRQDLP